MADELDTTRERATRAPRARRVLRTVAFVLLLLACAARWRAAGQAAVATQPGSSFAPTTLVEPGAGTGRS